MDETIQNLDKLMAKVILYIVNETTFTCINLLQIEIDQQVARNIIYALGDIQKGSLRLSLYWRPLMHVAY